MSDSIHSYCKYCEKVVWLGTCGYHYPGRDINKIIKDRLEKHYTWCKEKKPETTLSED